MSNLYSRKSDIYYEMADVSCLLGAVCHAYDRMVDLDESPATQAIQKALKAAILDLHAELEALEKEVRRVI